jgi:urease accessory protein UreF
MLDGVQIFGALVDEGTDLVDAELKADADLRQVGPDWESYCDYGVLFGIVCTACEVDGEEACVKLHVADIEGKVQAGVVIAEVLDADAECGADDTKETDTSEGGA